MVRACGIDVSLEHLDIDYLSLSNQARRLRLPNSPEGQRKLLKLCKEQKVTLAVMEATGGMERDAHVLLHKGGIPVALTNPLCARRFAQSLGQRAKSDAIDGRILREMGESLKLAVRPPASADQHALARLSVRRTQLLEMRQMEANRRGQEKQPFVRKSIAKTIAFLEKELKQIDAQLSKLVKEDEVLEEAAQIIDAIPGFARKSAVALVCALPELGRLSRQQAGSLAGLACFVCDSGQYKGQRRIQGGRARVRQALFMPALTAIKKFEPTKTMFERLSSRPGHVKMQAIIACMRKLLVIINARVKEMLIRRELHNHDLAAALPGLG